MKRSYWMHAFLALASLVTALYILSMPLNRFEWMLSDPALADQQLNFCTLPLDDSAPAEEAFPFLLPLLLLATALSVRARRLHASAWYAALLLALWGIRFFLLAPHCPARSSF